MDQLLTLEANSPKSSVSLYRVVFTYLSLSDDTTSFVRLRWVGMTDQLLTLKVNSPAGNTDYCGKYRLLLRDVSLSVPQLTDDSI